jgi:hypothetical protein
MIIYLLVVKPKKTFEYGCYKFIKGKKHMCKKRNGDYLVYSSGGFDIRFEKSDLLSMFNVGYMYI